jgi:hypothetical protein
MRKLTVAICLTLAVFLGGCQDYTQSIKSYQIQKQKERWRYEKSSQFKKDQISERNSINSTLAFISDPSICKYVNEENSEIYIEEAKHRGLSCAKYHSNNSPTVTTKRSLPSSNCDEKWEKVSNSNDVTQLRAFLLTPCGTQSSRFVGVPVYKGLALSLINDLLKNNPAQAISVKQELPSPSTGPSIKEAKKECADIGFKPKTEKFGTCVLQLTDN